MTVCCVSFSLSGVSKPNTRWPCNAPNIAVSPLTMHTMPRKNISLFKPHGAVSRHTVHSGAIAVAELAADAQCIGTRMQSFHNLNPVRQGMAADLMEEGGNVRSDYICIIHLEFFPFSNITLCKKETDPRSAPMRSQNSSNSVPRFRSFVVRKCTCAAMSNGRQSELLQRIDFEQHAQIQILYRQVDLPEAGASADWHQPR